LGAPKTRLTVFGKGRAGNGRRSACTCESALDRYGGDRVREKGKGTEKRRRKTPDSSPSISMNTNHQKESRETKNTILLLKDERVLARGLGKLSLWGGSCLKGKDVVAKEKIRQLGRKNGKSRKAEQAPVRENINLLGKQ